MVMPIPPFVGNGPTAIWYMKQSFFRDGIMGVDWCIKQNKLPSRVNLSATHVKLGYVPMTDPELIYMALQAENWSPNGEAREFISASGASHTSLSVGDVLRLPDRTVMVDNAGFVSLAEGKGILDGVVDDEKLIESLLTEDVGDTIFQQLKALGWNGLPLWGANMFVKGPDFLMFKCKGRNAMTGGKIKIILAPSDTYTVELWKLRGAGATKINSADDIYVDMLGEVITNMLGA